VAGDFIREVEGSLTDSMERGAAIGERAASIRVVREVRG
jgi:hypothetical protein